MLQLEIPVLADVDLRFMEEYFRLQPIANSLNMMLAQKDLYFRRVLPTLLSVKGKLNKLDETPMFDASVQTEKPPEESQESCVPD